MGGIKELKKLGAMVSEAAMFAQQIKARVMNDLETLSTLEKTVIESQEFLNMLNSQVKDAKSTLTKLQALLE